MINPKDNKTPIAADKPHKQSSFIVSGVVSFTSEEFHLFFQHKMAFKSKLYILAVCLGIFSLCLIEEVESRRVILMGRKAITRTYFKKPLIPAWATVVLIGVFMLVLGGGIYFLLNKIILGDLVRGPKFSKVSKSEAEV